ncbi:sulfatase-like hydrolase/transferase [Aeromonas sp. QDB12]|uniref:sulfatase-like hydrolase/transferase n=1 Tax=Aeromonas sp. QDB12 TaxID=2990483 RepID=UPI003FA49419
MILIMGESQNIDNMSAFGYKLDTTPYLREHSNEGVLKKTDHNHLSWKLADQSIQ